MAETLNKIYFCVVSGIQRIATEIKEDEQGVTNIVAAIILLMITILLVAIFWDTITELVNGWLDTINSNAGGIGQGLGN